MNLKDFITEAVSRGRNTKQYIEISPYMDVWEWIDELRKTGLEEEHTTDLFVEPVPGKIYVSRFSNTGEWTLKFIAGSMRLKVFFYPDGKFECIYSKKSKSAGWTFRKDVGPCIAEINYWLPDMVKEAVSRGLQRSRKPITKEMLLKHDSSELEDALELVGFTQNEDIMAMLMGDKHGAISSSEPQFYIKGFSGGTSIWLYPGNNSRSMYYIQLDQTGIQIKCFFMVNHSKNGTVRSVANTNSTTYWITDDKEAIDLLKDIMVVN